MFTTQLLVLLAFGMSIVSAHFRVEYPYWRGDSFKSQYTRPCGGVNVTTNRTQWPVDGGAILFKPTHHWALTYVNLGLGDDDSIIFNYTLVQAFNQTGNGTFCFPKIPIPADLGIRDGTNASLQIVQASTNGAALYNCMDITFSSSPRNVLAQDMCVNSTGVGGVAITSAPASGEGKLSSGGAISNAGVSGMGATALLAMVVASLLI
ncbi:hypothetical protein MGYG_05906 [Nannizzia gypsea CBS 118893]|uniref:Copper acquisition factor BIM1-like domain-containing protein n=1 Tax=Arthroderma gypseum (strain ATCC MYA-4604 / CBS 118893) TaxID=535722 RepID=E4UZW8_ARTGP|nr:hypothetical protein MGYG_05906 [Nannizzia gypsea CBS 118893]EFR02905.1 hypothetical protein MGYG_05906 [Nannizzia gypsea CBS 118893]